jgi:hypothetical protein
MKLTSGKINQMLVTVLTFVFVTGFCVYGPAAGQARPVKKQENTQQTAGDSNGSTSPAPVVDDSPINPDTTGKKKAGDTQKQQKNSDQDGKKTQKKFTPHKLW